MPDTPSSPAAIRLMLGSGLPLSESELAALCEYREEVAADLDYIDRRIAAAERDLESERNRRAWAEWSADRAAIRDAQAGAAR